MIAILWHQYRKYDLNPILANVWNPCMGWGGGQIDPPPSVSEVWRLNVTCFTFLNSSRALSKESAKIFAHLQKLGSLFAKKAYIAKKCLKFFFSKYDLLYIFFDIAIQNMQKYLQNIKQPRKYSRNQKYAFPLHWSMLQKIVQNYVNFLIKLCIFYFLMLLAFKQI